jgi:hypothetical protein
LCCFDLHVCVRITQAGALLGTCALELWPRATRLSPSAASAGAALGAVAATAVQGFIAILCALTGGCVTHRLS